MATCMPIRHGIPEIVYEKKGGWGIAVKDMLLGQLISNFGIPEKMSWLHACRVIP